LKNENDVLIYTYGLSPFSSEAVSILEATGCEYTNIELGKEWFLLGGEGSETRVALSKEVDGGATSLPKIFIGGECIGGCAELANFFTPDDVIWDVHGGLPYTTWTRLQTKIRSHVHDSIKSSTTFRCRD